MARSEAALRQTRAYTLLSCAAVVLVLYLARDILLPFALAVLLCFLLAPFVTRLERWGLPRLVAVLVAVAVAFSALGVLGSVVANELYDVADRLPEYKANIANKTKAFRSDGGGVFKKVTDALAEVRAAAAPPASPGTDPADSAGPGDGRRAAEPVLVEVVDEYSAGEVARSVLGPILGPLGMAAVVVVLVIFMLLRREDLRNRLIHLAGSGRLNVTTQALDDAGSRLGRYLVTQLLINAAYGLVIAAGLYFVGLPNPLLWGALTAVLRFVPFVGPWIAAVIPITISLAIFDGWTRPLLVLGLFLLNELVSNNVLEPWLYGASTGISSMGILVSAAFWTWLWGPVGLVMATPLTVCLTTLGRYVPHLAFLNTLLSDEEALPPEARFYQRLLALDAEEALGVAEDYLEQHSLEALYDAVLLPALSLAEQDRHHGSLDESKQRLVLDTLRALVDDLGSRGRPEVVAEGSQADGSRAAAAAPPPDVDVLCLPARDEADEIAGLMLAQLLEARGVAALVLPTTALVGEVLAEVAGRTAGVVCVSALPPLAAAHAWYLCKRLRPRLPDVRIVVGLWRAGGGTRKSEARLSAAGADKVVSTLAEAAEQLAGLAASHRRIHSEPQVAEARVAPAAG